MSNAVKKDTVYDQLGKSIDDICSEVKQLRLDKLKLLNDLNHVRTQLNLIEDAVRTIRNFPTILLPNASINSPNAYSGFNIEDEIVKEESPFEDFQKIKGSISAGDDDGHK